MATQNDYNLAWMNSNQIMMPEANGLHQQVPSDIMAMDQTSHLDSSYYPMQVPQPFESVGQQPMELDGFLMMDDFSGDYCDEPPRFITSATQTLRSHRKKISPVKHPGLKLQTPIAFKCDTDPNVIPIQKDGMAICEKCGAIGVKHAFYTRHRKYCSLACARNILDDGTLKDGSFEENSQPESNSPCQFNLPNGLKIKDEELVTTELLPFHTDGFVPSYNVSANIGTFPFTSFELPDEKFTPSINTGGRGKHDPGPSYDWQNEINNPMFIAAPVNCFKHAPMSDNWDDITVDIKVEVENSEEESDNRMQGFPDSFWVATVKRIAGYKAQLRYEGFGAENDFWVNLCSANVHPVGWCATRGNPLIPPKSIAENCRDWKDFLVRRLTGARTLPSNFYYKVQESLKSRFRVGLHLEVVDKEKISQMCVATIRRIVGKRLHVTYYNGDTDSGFWCHEDSPLIHPVGWSARVGHDIDAPSLYHDRCESGIIDKDDASDELFTAPFQCVSDSSSRLSFSEEMRLEAIDPLNLSAICVATVKKVLRDGYLMIRIDSYNEGDNGNSWFCYHRDSPNIFPPGFCNENGITLVPPADFKGGTFDWHTYARETGSTLAPASLFKREDVDHGFEEGMHVESADLISPWLVCVASVAQVVGRLLKIHFHGWPDEFDQWMDCHSPDVYPVGWCALVSHKLEPEANQGTAHENQVIEKKKGRRGRRRKGVPPGSAKPPAAASKKSIPMDEDSNAAHPTSTSIYDFNDDADNSVPPPPLHLPGAQPVEESTKAVADSSLRVPPTLPSETPEDPPSGTSEQITATYIPRLTDCPSGRDGELNPSLWTCDDVATFLRLNDCRISVDVILAQKIHGKEFLELTQDRLMTITGKIGPSVKIFALIQQLKSKAKAKKSHSH